jgi:Type II restriction endonuclease EcoO109I
MPELALHDITAYVEANIDTFHQARLASLARLNLEKIVKRKKPLSLPSEEYSHRSRLR